jgi:soluble lytic murein transglycosylase-like protein
MLLACGPLIGALFSTPKTAFAAPAPHSYVALTVSAQVPEMNEPEPVLAPTPPANTPEPLSFSRLWPTVHVAYDGSGGPGPRIPWNGAAEEQVVIDAANQNGLSPNYLLAIGRCESGLRPDAYNPDGPWYGMFQFLWTTFKANGGTNIWDPVDNASTAARMLAHGQAWQWSCARGLNPNM